MPEVTINNIIIRGIAVAVPENRVSTNSYTSTIAERELESWVKNHGILNRHIAIEEQTTSDLGYLATEALLQKNQIDKDKIGGIIVATSTPDYRSPATACVLQGRLELSKDCISFDLNIGDCGFIIGLQIASAIMATINKEYFLLIAGDTTSKQLDDNSPTSLFFGDGASAILLKKAPDNREKITVKTGTISSAFNTMTLLEGGFRDCSKKNDQGYLQFSENLWWKYLKNDFIKYFNAFLDGLESEVNKDNILVIPQMGKNAYTIFSEQIRQHVGRYCNTFEHYANTRGASIPLTLAHIFGKEDTAEEEVRVLAGALGEGISWGIAVFTINKSAILPIIATNEYYTEGGVAREI